MNRVQIAAVVLLLALHAGLLWHSAVQESATVDELSHLATGLYAWETGDFRLNRATCPMQNMLCALPVYLFADYRVSFDHQSWQFGVWNGMGTNLVKDNPDHFHELLMLGRNVSIFLSVLLCFLIFQWTKEWWGINAALFVLFLTILEPNFMAHGHLTTTDTASALFFLFAGYRLDRFLQCPTWKTLLWFGLSLGLAGYAKQSGFVVLTAVFTALFFHSLRHPGIFDFFTRNRPLSANRWIQSLIHAFWLTGILFLITFILIWAGYGFECGDSIRPALPAERYHLWRFASLPYQTILLLLGRGPVLDTENDPFWRLLKNYLPAFSYWECIFSTQARLIAGHQGYLLGNLYYGGRWLFYPVLFLFKTPLPLMILYMIGVAALAARWTTIAWDRLVAIFLIPGFYLFVLIFFNTANIGYRHALPIVPFLLIFLVGPTAQFMTYAFTESSLPKVEKAKHGLLGGLLLAWCAVDVLSVHPHYLEYFNLLAGGPKNGHWIAVDSNLDWGQDLLFIKDYLQKKGLNNAYLVYFGPEELPDAYGAPHRNVGSMQTLQPGVYVITATASKGIGTRPLLPLFAPLLSRPPDEYITPAVFVYRVP